MKLRPSKTVFIVAAAALHLGCVQGSGAKVADPVTADCDSRTASLGNCRQPEFVRAAGPEGSSVSETSAATKTHDVRPRTTEALSLPPKAAAPPPSRPPPRPTPPRPR